MDDGLRALFLGRGLTEEQVLAIQEADSELRSTSDLAAGATSLEDARAWAEELGLNGRVVKSRFIQSWSEARLLDTTLQAVAPEPAPAQPSSCAVLVSNAEDEEEHVAEADWSWVKVAPAGETRIALSYIDGEPVSRPGGLSDLLRSSLRSNGITSIEAELLEQNLEPRSCKALAVAAATNDGAMRLARMCGINSKVSQENFAKSWHEAAAATLALDAGTSKPESSLAELLSAGDFEACTEVLKRRAKVSNNKDLLPLLRGMFGHLAEKQRLAEEAAPQSKKASKVLTSLAALYGEEAKLHAGKEADIEKAEWRWRWMVKSLFPPRLALELQSEILAAYQDPGFQEACTDLSKSWDARAAPPSLEQKMKAIEELCLEQALARILPSYGFSADARGIADMKEAVSKFTKSDTEVRRKQMEITTAVMKKFKL